jgi:hypothetical protein
MYEQLQDTIKMDLLRLTVVCLFKRLGGKSGLLPMMEQMQQSTGGMFNGDY